MTEADKRDRLRERIEAAEARNAERSLGDYARDAAEGATDFVKRHPFTAVAGVAVIGLAIGAMTRPGRRAGKKAGKRASAFASYAAEIGLAYATGLLDKAGEAGKAGQSRLGELGGAAAERGHDAADAAQRLSRQIADKAGRSMKNLRSRLPH
jgi:ElaB/YqjD/DUF883 family membrane-anchored ribosome-binding protein